MPARHRSELTDSNGNSIGTATVGGAKVIKVAVVQSVSTSSGAPATGSDTFTGTTNGVTIDSSGSPVKSFGLQVTKTGSITSWTVILEGSLDNTTFTTILTHDSSASSDGSMMWSGSIYSPSLYFRSRCSAISLGGGTNIVATILGIS